MWSVPKSLLEAFALESGSSIAELTSHSNTSASEPAMYLHVSSTHSLRRASDRVWKNRPWSRDQFSSLISDPSQQKDFEDWWMRRCSAFRVPTSPVLEKVPESTEKDRDCSFTSSEPVAIWDAECFSWRTSRRLLLGGYEKFSGRFPSSGSMRNGRVYRQPKLELLTREIDGSAWATPRAGENGSDSGSKQRQKQGANAGLKDMAKNWPT